MKLSTRGEGDRRCSSNKTPSCNLDFFQHLLVTISATSHHTVSIMMFFLLSIIVFMLSLDACKALPLPRGLLGLLSDDYNMPTAAVAAGKFIIFNFLLLFGSTLAWFFLLRMVARRLLLPAVRRPHEHLLAAHHRRRQEERELHERLLAHRRNAATMVAAEQNWWDLQNFEGAIAAHELPARQHPQRDRPMFLFDSDNEPEDLFKFADGFNDDQ